jgi:methionyl-tRNA formyltransferase
MMTMDNNDKLKVLFCGARWLGIECLKELMKYKKDAEIIGAIIPRKNEKVWWDDIIDENEVRKFRIKIMSWEKVEYLKKIDLVFSVLHGPIFRQSFIRRVKYGIINLHPAPLPYYRGCNGNAHAIINREKKFGTSLHYVDEGIDTGSIIETYWIKINTDDTGKSLYDRTHKLASKLFRDKLPIILKEAKKGKKLPSIPQNNRLTRYYPRTSLSDKEANMLWPKRRIYDFTRALQFPPFEPAFFKYKGKKIHLFAQKGQLVLKYNINQD